MEYEFTQLDDFVATAIMSFSSKEAKINLMKFDPDNVAHKCAFEICAIIGRCFALTF